MKSRSSTAWILVTAALFAVATAQRIWNLACYKIGMGFDADGNWEYIASLIARWHLPSPDAGWSTAHPPLFYALSAAIGRLMGSAEMEPVARATIAVCGLLALASVASVTGYVRDLDAGRFGPRTAVAAFLLLFLPVHVYISAMLGEEMVATAFVTFALVGLARELSRAPGERSDLRRPALYGALAGLGLLAKMSAVLPIAAAAIVLLAEGPQRGWLRALRSSVAFGAAAAVVGGWFYVHNLATYGYLYPHRLPVHDVMLEMPPGSRTALDYVVFPPAAFGPTLASEPSIVHSVWGSVWISAWFDSHRGFVPLRPSKGLRLAAHLLLVLGLVPAAAFLAGAARGARRAVLERSGPDRLFLLTTVLVLAGFAVFTWRNPSFVTVKASYLLALGAPYGVYASEALQAWTRGSRARGVLLAGVFSAIAAVVLVTFSYDLHFQKQEFPGTRWQEHLPAPKT